MTLRRALLALSLVALAASATASPSQSVPPAQPAPPATRAARPDEIPIDPISIAFDVSVDHDATDAAGPKLLKYVIDFVPAEGKPGTTYTLDLGKPAPVEGAIAVPLTKVLVPGTYVAHVRSVGRSLQTTTVTVGPFVITEKLGKTKADVEKELSAPDKPQPPARRDKRTKKPNSTQTEAQAAAPPPTPTARPANANDAKDAKEGNGADDGKSKDPKEGAKPANKGGFWKKVYGKVVG